MTVIHIKRSGFRIARNREETNTVLLGLSLVGSRRIGAIPVDWIEMDVVGVGPDFVQMRPRGGGMMSSDICLKLGCWEIRDEGSGAV